MREGRASHTAQRVALRRAAHQLLDRPVVFEDPLALRIVGRAAEEELRRNPRSFDAHPGSSRLRASMAVRSRHAEDGLARAIAGGVRQYVILGAGLDTFAYRSARADLRVFEVDHPATQAWKQARLVETGIAVPSHLAFVPVDFERDALGDRLRAAGWDAGAPTFCSWLGVTPYLERDAILATLRTIAATPPGGGVAFDYAVARSALGVTDRLAWDLLARRVAAAGEPFRGGLEPSWIARELRAIGFGELEDLSPDEINARWFAGRTDGLGVGRIGRLVTAWVATAAR